MLKLADGLKLPLDFATKTAAILAQRRKGKTYTGSVIAEEMVRAKQPFVALDPTGAWWGLRAGADGTSEGLPVVVLGGQHGDVPLERTGGRLIADLVVDEPGYYVIDFSLFESGEAERQFAIDFAERLYRAKGQPGRDFPLHLFVDEADRFVPQQIRKGSNETSARLLGAFEAIVRRGGLRGLGTTLISQRAAVVNKNVLEMLDILLVLRTLGPNDQAAIDGYIKAHGTGAERDAMMGSLASLDIGEAWVWEPGAEPPLFKRVRIRQRHTFNSSATPKPGEKRVEPKRLAAVDLAALEKRMAATIEKAKADDPKELRKRIFDLERELKTRTILPAAKVERVEVPVVDETLRGLLSSVIDSMESLNAVVGSLIPQVVVALDRATNGPAPTAKRGSNYSQIIPGPEAMASARSPKPQSAGSTPARVATPRQPSGGDPALDGAQQKILDVVAMLVQRGLTPNRDMVARWLDIHPNGGRYGSNLATLRAEGYLEHGFTLTAAGVTAARAMDAGIDGAKAPLDGAQRAIVDVLANDRRTRFTRDSLAEVLGLHPNGGRYGSNLARLRTMGLIPERGEIYLTEEAFR